MDLREFKDSIPSFIEQAVEVSQKVTDGKKTLTPSLESVKDLDGIIGYLHNLWSKKLINDTVAWNSSVAFGVLLGEMIIKEHGFDWKINDEGIPVVVTEDGNQMSPITKLYKIITDEDDCEGTPSGFYDGFKILMQYQAMSEEEKARITTYIGPEE